MRLYESPYAADTCTIAPSIERAALLARSSNATLLALGTSFGAMRTVFTG